MIESKRSHLVKPIQAEKRLQGGWPEVLRSASLCCGRLIPIVNLFRNESLHGFEHVEFLARLLSCSRGTVPAICPGARSSRSGCAPGRTCPLCALQPTLPTSLLTLVQFEGKHQRHSRPALHQRHCVGVGRNGGSEPSARKVEREK